MAYEVEEPIEETCFLKDTDPAGLTWVVIKEARGGADMQRDQLWAEFALERNPDGSVKREHYRMPGAKVTLLECWLTFVDANLQYKRKKRDAKTGKELRDDEGKPLYETVPMFKAGMSQADFEARFAQLPRAIQLEWHSFVLKLNPDWDPDAGRDIAKN